jgi:hypothetical protein
MSDNLPFAQAQLRATTCRSLKLAPLSVERDGLPLAQAQFRATGCRSLKLTCQLSARAAARSSVERTGCRSLKLS